MACTQEMEAYGTSGGRELLTPYRTCGGPVEAVSVVAVRTAYAYQKPNAIDAMEPTERVEERNQNQLVLIRETIGDGSAQNRLK